LAPPARNIRRRVSKMWIKEGVRTQKEGGAGPEEYDRSEGGKQQKKLIHVVSRESVAVITKTHNRWPNWAEPRHKEKGEGLKHDRQQCGGAARAPKKVTKKGPVGRGGEALSGKWPST